MKYYIFTLVVGLVGAFKSQSKDKLLASAYRSMPAITNSLVNLGKMDVAFYINAKDHDKNGVRKSPEVSPSFSSFYIPKVSSVPLTEEPCPCSMMKNLKDTFSPNSNSLLNKILTSNDLFSFKNPMTSPLCCESHEEFQDNIFFDIGSKMMQNPYESEIAFPAPILPLDSFLPRNSDLSSSKPKTIEIVFLPKKNFEKSHSKKTHHKKDIAVVGKEPKSFHKSSAATPTPSNNSTVMDEEKKEEKVLSPEDLNKAEQVPVKDSNSINQ